MEYIQKTLFIFDEHRLPNFLSKQILKENIFRSNEWNKLGSRFDLNWSFGNFKRSYLRKTSFLY